MGNNDDPIKIINDTSHDLTIESSPVGSTVTIPAANSHSCKVEKWSNLRMNFSNGDQIHLDKDQSKDSYQLNKTHPIYGKDSHKYTVFQIYGENLMTLTVTEGNTYTHNWMSKLSDDVSVSNLSIPGTHQAGASNNERGFTKFAQCQDIGLTEQLEKGIRFIDIRCRHYCNCFSIHHGEVYQKLNFQGVINYCLDFLNRNQSECILMMVREEHTSEGNTRSFEETFRNSIADNCPDRWYLGAKIPKLGDVRNKIVVLRRFPAVQEFGIDLSNWVLDFAPIKNNDEVSYRIQDFFDLSSSFTMTHKFEKVKECIQLAEKEPDNVLILNYMSAVEGTLLFGFYPSTVAEFMNVRTFSYLAQEYHNNKGRIGVIMMDFCQKPEPLIRRIILCNKLN